MLNENGKIMLWCLLFIIAGVAIIVTIKEATGLFMVVAAGITFGVTLINEIMECKHYNDKIRNKKVLRLRDR